MKHPSALGMFEEIMSAAKMKQVLIFLDYDGTLSPIVENPDQAYMAPEVCFFVYFFISIYMDIRIYVYYVYMNTNIL